jgi:hypothetical protein
MAPTAWVINYHANDCNYDNDYDYDSVRTEFGTVRTVPTTTTTTTTTTATATTTTTVTMIQCEL